MNLSISIKFLSIIYVGEHIQADSPPQDDFGVVQEFQDGLHGFSNVELVEDEGGASFVGMNPSKDGLN